MSWIAAALVALLTLVVLWKVLGSQPLALGLGVAVFVFTSVPTPLSPAGSQPAYAAFPGTVIYLHADVLGSSVLTTDQTGAVLQRASYKPFGDTAPAAGGGSSPVPEFGFTGQRFVAGVKIYDYGARWYDPGLGRFLQPDSVVPEPFDPQSLNRYSYVRNSPTNRIDPTGNFDIPQGLTDFFIEGIPSFFLDTLPDFFSSIPSFGADVFDSFYAALISPVVSGIGGLFAENGIQIDESMEVLLADTGDRETLEAATGGYQGGGILAAAANSTDLGVRQGLFAEASFKVNGVVGVNLEVDLMSFGTDLLNTNDDRFTSGLELSADVAGFPLGIELFKRELNVEQVGYPISDLFSQPSRSGLILPTEVRGSGGGLPAESSHAHPSERRSPAWPGPSAPTSVRHRGTLSSL